MEGDACARNVLDTNTLVNAGKHTGHGMVYQLDAINW